FEPDATHRPLYRAIEKPHEQEKQHGPGKHRALAPAGSEPQPQGYDERREREFLAKRRLLAERAGQSAQARAQGAQHPGQSARLVTVYDGAVGFHVRSSCRAARTSSRRRTGMVCGALVTRPGSCSASFWICDMADTNASRTSLLSVSVGSMSRHSGTSSGK